MKTCSKCGVAKPLDDFHRKKRRPQGRDSRCIECVNAGRRARRAADPEFRQKDLEACKKWQLANIEYVKCYKRGYAARESKRNVARMNAWKEANPERYRLNQINGQARRRARVTTPDPASREYIEILMKDPCVYCGGEMQHIDHIVPLVNAGVHDWENMTAACATCNTRKNAKSLLEFLSAQ